MSLLLIGYPGPPRELKDGNPGYPPGTQWIADDVTPIRANEGRFLLYTEATTKGNSGSPLYLFDTTGNKALATGVHVAGHALLGTNASVPVSFHLDAQEEYPDTASSQGMVLKYFLKIFINLNGNIILVYCNFIMAYNLYLQCSKV